MSLGFGFQMVCATRQRQRLTADQKHVFQQILELREELGDLSFPEAAKGIDGLIAAHQWLVKHKSKGLLFGGLAEKIWGQKKSPNALEDSKDVDVLIFPGYPAPEKKFEAGIDWWLPETDPKAKKVEYYARSYDASKAFSTHTFFKNGNDVVLYFSVAMPDLSSNYGLYLPSKNLQMALCIAEANALAYFNMDEEIEEKFVKKFKASHKFLHPEVSRRLCPLMTIGVDENVHFDIHNKVFRKESLLSEIKIQSDSPYKRYAEITLESINPRAVDAYGCSSQQQAILEKIIEIEEIKKLGKRSQKNFPSQTNSSESQASTSIKTLV